MRSLLSWSRCLRRPVLTPPGGDGVMVVAIASLAITAAVAGLNHWGWLQFLEMQAYDQLLRLEWRLRVGPQGRVFHDERLLIVGIDEADITNLGEFPISDRVLAQALAKLQRHRPRAIGLDLYRPTPQGEGHAALQRQLNTPNLVAITKLGDDLTPGVLPPAGVPEDRIGFNDVVVDPDGVVRRNLYIGVAPNSPTDPDVAVYYSLALRLAILYLGQTPQASPSHPEAMVLAAATFRPLHYYSGGYQTIDDRGYQVLLDYHSPRTPAQIVSLQEVLADEVGAERIRDRIVLIGSVAPSLRDLFYTPYSASQTSQHQMAGVVLHAQMVSQILDAAQGDGALIWTWPLWGEHLWYLVWAIAGGAAVWPLHRPLVLALVQLFWLLGLSLIALGAVINQGWIPVVAPALATVSSSGTVLAYQAQRSYRQRQMMQSLLGQNTSPAIAQALWENRDRLLRSGKLPGQRLTATLMFTDIRNFSSLAEVTAPEALLERLNDYLSAMTDEVQRHGGIVNKFTGDGLLAVFGVPIAHTQVDDIAHDAQSAVDCALQMARRLEQLNQHWQGQGLAPLEMRVGIFTGPVVVGSLGGSTRLEYGIIGDSVNIAARLESLDKTRQSSSCRILIGEATQQYLNSGVPLEHWGAFPLKGRQQTVRVFRVVEG
ncbi:adenylate-guanylate cyclase domain protein [Halomicronema hongdechloris C2206]|uniref:Adenylate-guanylate cyclase domain protein n=1 Tax=Halomicronema hongdechloris C2206 TaxID=1641165 RepID=A0A1Z3HKB7_9CYAN|nr:adenylate/guanylate cyclase domain-containing protein [Halomicronema hongdechloris]ASC70748.1 adenylate-guanylate cyclase domain protein [Halomicronema hongdechloris C2206]